METNQRIKGIYCKIALSTIGVAGTQKQVRTEIFCEAKDIDDQLVEVRYLGFGGEYSGIVERLEKELFLKNFSISPIHPRHKRDPKKQSLEKHIALADAHYKKKEYFAAEFEYDNALRFDEVNARANFGKGLALLQRGEKEKARETFLRLSSIEAFFAEENKHIFNEFGITLRKMGLCDEAIRHYKKALAICPNDEHLYFNMARAYLEKNEMAMARECIDHALRINPEFKNARQLLRYLASGPDGVLGEPSRVTVPNKA